MNFWDRVDALFLAHAARESEPPAEKKPSPDSVRAISRDAGIATSAVNRLLGLGYSRAQIVSYKANKKTKAAEDTAEAREARERAAYLARQIPGICVWCQGATSSTKYECCSIRCASALRYSRTERKIKCAHKPCAHCGGPKRSAYRECCSHSCAMARFHAAKRAAIETIQCPAVGCTRSFAPINDQHRACSKACSARILYAAQGRQGKLPPARARTSYTLPERACSECATAFMPRRSMTHTCGKACEFARTKRKQREWHLVNRYGSAGRVVKQKL